MADTEQKRTEDQGRDDRDLTRSVGVTSPMSGVTGAPVDEESAADEMGRGPEDVGTLGDEPVAGEEAVSGAGSSGG